MSKMGLGPHITALVRQGGIFEEIAQDLGKGHVRSAHGDVARA